MAKKDEAVANCDHKQGAINRLELKFNGDIQDTKYERRKEFFEKVAKDGKKRCEFFR